MSKFVMLGKICEWFVNFPQFVSYDAEKTSPAKSPVFVTHPSKRFLHPCIKVTELGGIRRDAYNCIGGRRVSFH